MWIRRLINEKDTNISPGARQSSGPGLALCCGPKDHIRPSLLVRDRKNGKLKDWRPYNDQMEITKGSSEW